MTKFKQVQGPSQILDEIQLHQGQDMLFSSLSMEELQARLALVTYGFFDYDGTVVEENQWAKLQELMSDINKELERLDRTYYFQNKDQFGNSPFPGNDFWAIAEDTFNLSAFEAAYVTRSIGRLITDLVIRLQIENIGANMTVRQGIKELFEKLQRVHIISYGIEQVIMACIKANFLDAKVCGWRLIFEDNNKRLISNHPRYIVVTEVKGQIVQSIMKREGLKPEQTLGLGDSLGDIDMMQYGGLNGLIIPIKGAHKKLDMARNDYLFTIWKTGKLSFVIVGDTFNSLLEVMGK